MRRSQALGRRQRGQAIVWFLGTLAAAAAVLYGVYSVSQITAGKAKAVNAADAAALAGATVEARLLNLVAYNNRSMMGNEVFLAQMVSLESWLGYVQTTADNAGTVLDILSLFPAFTAFTQPLAQFFDRIDDAIEEFRDDGLNPSIDGIITALEASKSVLGAAHQAIRILGGPMAESAASSIVAANRSNFNGRTDQGLQIDNRPAVRALTFVSNGAQFANFSQQYSADERGDARSVLLASRDGWSTNRPGVFWNNFSLGIAGMEKRGQTRLVGFERWEAQDTLDLWQKPFPGAPSKLTTRTPIGWGRANADEDGNAGDMWSGPNSTTQKLAYNDGQDHTHDNWTGVPSVFDIRDKDTSARATLGLNFVVAVARPQANTMTSANLGLGGVATTSPAGSSEMPEQLQGEQLSAMAKARVSFERPRRNGADVTGTSLFRGDSAKEYGSLFSPYWQARLTEFTVAEKAAMMTAMGINPLLSPLTPAGPGL